MGQSCYCALGITYCTSWMKASDSILKQSHGFSFSFTGNVIPLIIHESQRVFPSQVARIVIISWPGWALVVLLLSHATQCEPRPYTIYLFLYLISTSTSPKSHGPKYTSFLYVFTRKLYCLLVLEAIVLITAYLQLHHDVLHVASYFRWGMIEDSSYK